MDTLSLLRRRAGARRFSHDSNKSRRVQARAADQRAVDLGLGHELVDVLGLDAAAVEDPDALGDLLRPELREQTAQIPVDFAGLARCRVDARPDGPDRLGGEDDLPQPWGRHPGEHGGLPARTSATAARAVKGGQTTTCTPRGRLIASRIAPARVRASATVPCIFQLPMTIGVLTPVPR